MTLLPLLVAALAGAADGGVLARVDDVPITQGALLRRMEAMGPRAMRSTIEDVLQGLIEEALLAGEGRRLGLGASREVQERVDSELRAAAAVAMVEKEIGARAGANEARLRQSFHATADFVAYDLVVFDSRERAAAALRNIRLGSALEAESRGALVARFQPSAAAASPTLRAQIEAPLADELFRAQPGTVIGPVELATGFALARPLRKEIGTEAEFAARRPSLERYARAQLTSQARQHLAAQLRAKANVKLDEAFLRSVPTGGATAQQLEHVIATVDGRPLPYRDVEASLRALGAGSGHLASPGVRIAVALQLVEARLLEDLAVQRGFDRAPEVKARRTEIERAALAAAAAERIRRSTTAPGEDEIRDCYDRNAAGYGRPFEQVLPQVAARAAAEKQEAAVGRRIGALRQGARISVDRAALSRVTRPAA